MDLHNIKLGNLYQDPTIWTLESRMRRITAMEQQKMIAESVTAAKEREHETSDSFIILVETIIFPSPFSEDSSLYTFVSSFQIQSLEINDQRKKELVFHQVFGNTWSPNSNNCMKIQIKQLSSKKKFAFLAKPEKMDVLSLFKNYFKGEISVSGLYVTMLCWM